ncbi:SAM-dependent methyltransferase [Winogradskyella sp. R77965]|uniref:SAM-dependent methyltransferase n=1 Tax=Winogradskyella sp. R77965 TaxID=3093872 RepID=UPI0037DC8CA1
MDEKLTTQDYWEKYYRRDHANRNHIINVCSEYDLFWDKFILPDSNSKTIIEIGGYPARFLAYLSNKYKLKPTSLDFNSDKSQIERTFGIMGVNDYNIIQADFTKYNSKQKYDYLISLGFIEHFENFDEILDRHVPFVKAGGKILVMIPNKRYLRKYYGWLCDYENLKAHNLKCMNLNVFKDFAKRNHLKTDVLQYHGGFAYSVHQKLNFFQKFIYKVTRIIFKYKLNSYIEKHPTKYFSSSIIGIFEKPKN